MTSRHNRPYRQLCRGRGRRLGGGADHGMIGPRAVRRPGAAKVSCLSGQPEESFVATGLAPLAGMMTRSSVGRCTGVDRVRGDSDVSLAGIHGSPVLLEELLYKPQHSLIAQSMHSTLGAEATNGDGFGVGWYGAQETLVRGGAAPGESAGSDRGHRVRE